MQQNAQKNLKNMGSLNTLGRVRPNSRNTLNYFRSFVELRCRTRLVDGAAGAVRSFCEQSSPPDTCDIAIDCCTALSDNMTSERNDVEFKTALKILLLATHTRMKGVFIDIEIRNTSTKFGSLRKHSWAVFCKYAIVNRVYAIV